MMTMATMPRHTPTTMYTKPATPGNTHHLVWHTPLQGLDTATFTFEGSMLQTTQSTNVVLFTLHVIVTVRWDSTIL